MTKRSMLVLVTLLLTLQVACGGPSPTTQPVPQPTPAGALNVGLTTDAASYPAGGAEMILALTNNGRKPLYLPICGPWEIFSIQNPDRPAWAVECEIDYLGHLVEPGQVFTGRLAPHLEPGTYQARTEAYGDCALGQPQVVSPSETYYGDFSACSTRQKVVSPPFEIQ